MDVSQLLESINQNINEGIYRSNKKGLIYVNKAFAKMFGYVSEREIMEAGSLNLYKNPEDRTRLLEKLISFGSFENEEVTLVKRNGQEFIGLISSIIYEEGGETFWDGAIRDVTEQKEALRLAKANNLLLETINRNINEAIYRSVIDEGLVYINEEFVRMFGYNSAEEIYNSEAINLYKNSEQRQELGDELIRDGSISNREVEFKRKDGTTFWGYLSSIKTTGDDGTIYFDGAIRDITKQKESDEALKYHARMQNTLINLSTKYINLPVDQLDESIMSSLEELGRFVSADRAYIFKYNKEQNTYSNTFEWCREGISSAIAESQNLKMDDYPALVNDHLNGKTIFIDEVSKMTDKASRKMLEKQEIKSLISVPMMNGDTCVGFVGFDSVKNFRTYSDDETLLLKVTAEIFVNILSRAASQKQLNLLLQTTNDQNKRLKDFSYITSHNFRSSVANLLSLTKILESDPGNVEYIGMLKVTTRKLSEAINNINELLNFENEVSLLKRENCNIFKTVEDVLELNNHGIVENGIEVETQIPSDLEVKGVQVYLESIFQNVITNAIKYGTTNGLKKIKIFAEKTGSEVMVMIKDYGLGIDLKRYRDKLFKPGTRFHPEEKSGQGMGLFMTKQQMEAMGGRIDVESDLNKGTTFKLVFNGR